MITGEILNIKTDANGNVEVLTEYKDDAGNLLYRGVSGRYSFNVTSTEQEMIDKIKEDINLHCQKLMTRQLVKSQNSNFLENIKGSLIGHKEEVVDADLKLKDKILTVKDGAIISERPIGV